MTNVQVRDVPDRVLTLLKGDATRRGLSLQRYLRELLEAHAGVINNSRLLDEARADLDGLPAIEDDAAELIRLGREERDRALGLDR